MGQPPTCAIGLAVGPRDGLIILIIKLIDCLCQYSKAARTRGRAEHRVHARADLNLLIVPKKICDAHRDLMYRDKSGMVKVKCFGRK